MFSSLIGAKDSIKAEVTAIDQASKIFKHSLLAEVIVESDLFNAIICVPSLDRGLWRLHFILYKISDHHSQMWPLLILAEKEMNWWTVEK